MDYVLGSVAALVTGNVTPNRPKLMKRALTPTKHQPSPNVTPKSEFVEDRSIFLSPNMQKKKAIVKKSPKRIFQNPELENPENGDSNVSLTSPKADKVKKHLKDELEADSSISSQKSPKKKGNNKRESTSTQENDVSITEQNDNENTPKKKKKKLNSESETIVNVSTETTDNASTENNATAAKSPKKRKQRRKSLADPDTAKENNTNEPSNEPLLDKSPKKQDIKTNVSVPTEKNNDATDTSNTNTPKKKLTKSERRRLAKARAASASTENKDKESDEPNKENIQKENQVETKKKKNRKRKKSKGQQSIPEKMDTDESKPGENDNEEAANKSETENKDQEANKENQVAPKKKKNRNRKKSKGKQNEPQKMDTNEPKPVESKNEEDDDSEENAVPKSSVNPNAITDKESDSEHESDDEIESENEEINKKVLESEKPEVSSDEEDEEPKKKQKKEVEKKEDDGEFKKGDEEEVKRTLFVGNVPFNPKVKKEMKKIFGKHGQIETIRIRTVPIKDARYTPKLAAIKNELHPERSTVNVYIKYTDAESVEKALVENNTVLNENHLRVTRSSSTGVEHDPNMSIFVGNMPYAMEDEAFRAIFEKCGEIKSVRIIRDQKTNAGKGFGYVNFESKDAVELALALSEEDLTVKNRIMRVKRVTQTASSKKPVKNNTGQKHSGYKGGNHQPNQQGGGGFNNKANQQRGGFRGNQGNQQGGFRSGNNDNQQRGGNNQRFQQRNGPPSRNNQGNRQRAFAGGNDQQRGFNNKSGDQKNLSQKDEHGRDGAYRRVMNKRKNEENGGGDAPPNKIQKQMNEPREKKSRKEFVGMTAEKKKKRKFDKGQKKKKALSEILTK